MCDCENSCQPGNMISSKKVYYTGEKDDDLGICPGDSLEDVIEILMSEIKALKETQNG